MEYGWNGITKMAGISPKTYFMWNGWNPPRMIWIPYGFLVECGGRVKTSTTPWLCMNLLRRWLDKNNPVVQILVWQWNASNLALQKIWLLITYMCEIAVRTPTWIQWLGQPHDHRGVNKRWTVQFFFSHLLHTYVIRSSTIARSEGWCWIFAGWSLGCIVT